MRLCQWTALGGILIGASLCSAEGEPAKHKPDEIVARFHDGTVIRRIRLQENLEITTKYGKLTVPVKDIRRIDFGFRLSEETARKVDEAVAKLGSDDFKDREAAAQELVLLGFQAYPALVKAAKSTDKEVSRRAQTAIEAIREQVPDDQLRTEEDDQVHTHDSVLSGRIVSTSISARTQAFGELQFKLWDLRAIHSIYRSQLTVEADKYGVHVDQWMDSGFTMESGASLLIVATGKIDLAPQQPGQAVSGPEGWNGGNRSYNNQAFLYGALLGRVGPTGEIFYVGKRFDGKTKQQGKLFLHIVPGGTNAASGTYGVKISTDPKLAAAGKGDAKQMAAIPTPAPWVPVAPAFMPAPVLQAR